MDENNKTPVELPRAVSPTNPQKLSVFQTVFQRLQMPIPHEKIRRFFGWEILSFSCLSGLAIGLVGFHRFGAAILTFSVACLVVAIQVLFRFFSMQRWFPWKITLIVLTCAFAVWGDWYLMDVVKDARKEYYAAKESDAARVTVRADPRPSEPREAEEHIEHGTSKPNPSIAKNKPIPKLKPENPQPVTIPITSEVKTEESKPEPRDAAPVGPVTKSPLVYNGSGGKFESHCGTWSTGGRTAIENHGEVKSDRDSFDAPSSCSPEQEKIADVDGFLERSYNTPETFWVGDTAFVLRHIFNDDIAKDFLAQPDIEKKRAFLKKLKESIHP